jgi:peptide chain release factor 1
VAVLDPLVIREILFNERDFRIEWYSGTGCGGQYRNKHQNSCRIIHLASGMIATAQCRSRENSLNEACQTILARLNSHYQKTQTGARANERSRQVGLGERGDKRRTYRFQEDRVKDHITGQEASLTRVMQGNIDLLW